MYNIFNQFLTNKQSICIIQAENPDGDSLGSALALDYLIKNTEISLYCPVDIPKYLHYFPDWSRVTNEFDFKADGYIIVDTAAEILLSKLLDDTVYSMLRFSSSIITKPKTIYLSNTNLSSNLALLVVISSIKLQKIKKSK